MDKRTHTLPSGTMNSMATIVATNHSGFCPHETIQAFEFESPWVAQELSGSIAWMLDTWANNTAKNILYTRFESFEGSFEELMLSVGEDLQHESLYENEGAEQTLAVVHSLREKYHDIAASCAGSNDRDYKTQSLRARLEGDKKKVSSEELNNLKALAQAECPVAEEADEFLENMLAARAADIDKQNERAKQIIPTIIEIHRSAKMFAESHFDFIDLPLTKQEALVKFMVKTLARLKVTGASALAKKPLEYARAIRAVKKQIDLLENVLWVRYPHTDDLENCTTQGMLDNGRSAKRRACSID